MRQSMMLRVRQVVWTERVCKDLWAIQKPVESATVSQRMADVSRY